MQTHTNLAREDSIQNVLPSPEFVQRSDDRFSLNSRGRHNNNGGGGGGNSTLGITRQRERKLVTFPSIQRFTSSELLRTSRIGQRFGSTVDFITKSGKQLT